MLRMKEIGRYGLLVLLIGLIGGGSAMAAERVALVIGNSEYAGAPYLSNPQRDAQAIARALTGIGFQVTGPLLNQSKAQMEAALGRFGRQAQGATAAVVYFAGHGVEVGGQNYLLPTDAVLDRESDASLRAVALNVVLDQMGGASNYRLVILDACRDNPMANNMRRSDGTRSASRGLAPIDPSGQTYVAYAARAGQRAKDGAAGDHSPYAAALLKYLPQSGLPLERLFGAVREEVLRTTTREQEPALYGAFGSAPIYLAGPGAAASIASAPVPVVAAPPPAPAVDHDYEAWKSAEKCGTAACFEAYLEDYPKGRYAKMARARLKPVESVQSTASRPPAIASTAPEERPRPSRLSEGTIRIAVAGPITGPVAQYGDMQMIGAKMAVEQINAKGGVNGKKLEAVLMDDMCEPQQAVAVANQIINQKIKYVVGHLCSGSTFPASKLYEEEGILMITPAATNPAITQQGYRMVFRSIGTDDQQGPTAGRYIATQIKPKKLAIIHDSQTYGKSIAEEVRKTVEVAGIKPVLFEGINKSQSNFSSLITKMKKDGVDFVYYGGYHPELGLLLRQSHDQGFYVKFMGPEGVGNREISAIAGPASEGLLVTLPADFSADPINAALVKAFDSKNQDPTGPFVMTSYAAVQIIVEAIRGAQTEDPVKLADYIRKNSFDTSIGSVVFKNNGDLKEFSFVIFSWHADATKSSVR